MRRYLLGELTDEECEALEREYFANEAALSRVESEEEALIEEYLAGRLNVRERDLFEQRYLASPIHRRRVDTVRRLLATSSSGAQTATADRGARAFPYEWLALAAAVILAVGALWMLVPGKPAERASDIASANRPADASTPATQPPPAPSPQSTAPRVFAFSLSPIQTRSADDAPRLVIPAGTDVVALQLEGTGPPRAPLNQSRAEIRTVTGVEIWKGSATSATDLPSTAARIDVPAAKLPTDDYIVILLEARAPGSERERNRYFLRVR